MRYLLTLAIFGLILSACEFSNEPHQVSFDEALDVVQRAADRGDDASAVTFETIRFRQNPTAEGLNRLRGYALLGHASASHAVAEAYMHGRTVAIDYEEAARWLQHAADHGDARANHMLATYAAHRTADES